MLLSLVAASAMLPASASADTCAGGESYVFNTSLGPAGIASVNRNVVVPSNGASVYASIYVPPSVSEVSPAPAVLETHGGGQNRAAVETDIHTKPLLQGLLGRGYVVITWDTRGHGQSTSPASEGGLFGPIRYTVTQADAEVADVRALVDRLGACTEVAQESAGDPRVGMAGFSNGGLIQLAAAAGDSRIDAITPAGVSGHVARELFSNGVASEAFRSLYEKGYGYGAGRVPDTAVAAEIHNAYSETTTGDGLLSQNTSDWLEARSATAAAPGVKVPTAIVQGTPDTSTPLQGGLDVYGEIHRLSPSVPLKVAGLCFGHAGCPYTSPAAEANANRWTAIVMNWLDRYLRGLAVDVGSPVEWQAQDGVIRGAPEFPLPGTTTTVASGSFTPPEVIKWPDGGGVTGGDTATGGTPIARPAPSNEYTADYVQGFSLIRHPGSATTCLPIVGSTTVTMSGNVTSTLGQRGWIFLELQDNPPPGGGAKQTIGQMATARPLPVGPFDDMRVDLHATAWLLKPGHSLQLEISTGSRYYVTPTLRPAYNVAFDHLRIEVPQAPAVTATPNPAVPRDFNCV